MEDKNENYIKGKDLPEENLDNLEKNDIDKDELNSINKEQEAFLISKKETEVNNNIEIENKEVPKAEIKENLKIIEDNNKAKNKEELNTAEDNNKAKNKEELNTAEDNNKTEMKEELNTAEDNNKTEMKEELNTAEDNNKTEIKNKEVSKAKIKEKLDKKNSEDKEIKTNSDLNQIPIKKSNQTIKDSLDVKPKLKPKKEIPIEKKPFNEFINDHLIPEIINEFKIRGKIIEEINIKKTNRPISEDICWVIYCEVQETCNFWLSFEKEDITSLKSFSLCKNYEKPSIIESFLIDEKKITLKLIISRILQRLNGQKLIGAN